MDKALGSDDVDKLVWVLTCTRSSSAFANRRPQYSVPENKIFVYVRSMHFLSYSNEVLGTFFFQKLLKLLLIMNKKLELQVINVAENQKL